MKKIILAFVFTIITSCAAKTPVAEKVEEKEAATLPTKLKPANCLCIKMWMPVCGENKKTYGNSCEADCAGVKYTNGECHPSK